MMDVEVSVNMGTLATLDTELAGKVDYICRDSAFAVEKKAKLLCIRDTGACKASIYTVTSKGADYSQNCADAEAKAASRGKKITLLPQAHLSSKIEALVSVGVNYGLWLELGLRRKAGPAPFMIPAMDSQRSAFVEACNAVLGRL